MRILVACEFSGIVRDAFIASGHDAVSCDIIPTMADGPHIQANVMSVLSDGWDMMIAHPPCTALCVSGNRWYWDKTEVRLSAVEFVRRLLDAPIPRICIENPRGILSTRLRKPDQIIHPWQYGHGEVKETHLWLKGLPRLVPTQIVTARKPRVHWEKPGTDRWMRRSKTYQGIALAMSTQWGKLDADSASTNQTGDADSNGLS